MSTVRIPGTHVSKYIYEYPEHKEHEFNTVFDSKTDNLTMGDLHGNPVKLIHLLIDHGIADLPGSTLDEKKQQFQALVDCYNTPHLDREGYLTETPFDVEAYRKNCIEKFREILASLKFCDKPPLLRLLGDILADRGKNDLLTLFTIMLLHENNLPYEINLSNHDEVFLRVFYEFIDNPEYADRDERFGAYDPIIQPSTSLENCGVFTGVLAETNKEAAIQYAEEIKTIFKTAYLPKLKFINYEYNETSNTFSIFTHAPVGLITIELLAEEFNIPYDDSSVKNLITTIEAINEKMVGLANSRELNNMIIKGGELYEQARPGTIFARRDDYKNSLMQEIKDQINTYKRIPESEKTPEQQAFIDDHKKMALYRMIWERVANKSNNMYDFTDMPKTKNGINFMFNHGHDRPTDQQTSCEHIKKYDSVRGKHLFQHEKHFHDLTFGQVNNNVEATAAPPHNESSSNAAAAAAAAARNSQPLNPFDDDEDEEDDDDFTPSATLSPLFTPLTPFNAPDQDDFPEPDPYRMMAPAIIASPYKAEDYFDHDQSKGFNSSVWPIIKQMDAELMKLNAIIARQQSKTQIFDASNDKLELSLDIKHIRALIPQLPTTVANEYLPAMLAIKTNFASIFDKKARKTPRSTPTSKLNNNTPQQ